MVLYALEENLAEYKSIKKDIEQVITEDMFIQPMLRPLQWVASIPRKLSLSHQFFSCFLYLVASFRVSPVSWIGDP